MTALWALRVSDMSITRKFKRTKKKQSERDIKQKINMFDRMPDYCVVCQKPFDKKDREQVKTWIVVERAKKKSVNLYCPQCWSEGTVIASQMIDAYDSKKSQRKEKEMELLAKKVEDEMKALRKNEESSGE